MSSAPDRCEFVLTPAEVYPRRSDVEDIKVEATADGWELKIYRDEEWENKSINKQDWDKERDAFSCWREVWQDGRCVWHAEAKDKPVADLETERTDNWERLDCAVLSESTIQDNISFRDCSLSFSKCIGTNFENTDFADTNLRAANFTDANLLGADLTDTPLQFTVLAHTSLFRADLTGANLREADLSHASLKRTDLSGANLGQANFTDANLEQADFNNADLQGADFTDADLEQADLNDADLQGADFTDISLEDADFIDADLKRADLTHASLKDADLQKADLQEADLTGTTLTNAEAKGAVFERAVLTRTNLFDTDLTGAKFYATTFDEVKVNRRTEFGDASDDDLNEAESADTEDGDTTLWDKTAWKYRQLHELALDNALPEKARKYHITRKNVRHREYRARGGLANWYRWLKATASWAVWEYGENPRRVIGFSVLTILAFGLLFPFFGGMQAESPPDTQAFAFDPITTGALDLPNWVTVVLANLYFSGVTFTTLGYGDIQPATPAVETLATIESFLGALLMALLVFVLGRRSTW